jgi:hypothetical protein
LTGLSRRYLFEGEDIRQLMIQTFRFTEPEVQDKLITEIIDYEAKPSWSTFTDAVVGYEVQYPLEHKLNDESKEGARAYFNNCGTENPETGEKICTAGFSIGSYDDYKGGSRMVWLNSKFSIFKPYYQNFVVDGRKALIAIEGNPGGSSSLFVAIPNGSRVVVLMTDFYAWDPNTGKLPDLSYIKDILSTFRFTD